MVVADKRYIAEDALALIAVDIESCPPRPTAATRSRPARPTSMSTARATC